MNSPCIKDKTKQLNNHFATHHHKEILKTDNTASFQPSVFAQISHELRIPLTGIFGMVHFLKQTPLNAKQKGYLHLILDSAQQLGRAEEKICTLFKNRTI